MKFNLPDPIKCEVTFHFHNRESVSHILSASSGFEIELQLLRSVIPNDIVTIRMLRGNLPEMMLYFKNGEHHFYKNHRPSMIDNNPNLREVIKCVA